MRSTRRKTSRSKDENQQPSKPTFGAKSRNRTRVELIKGECCDPCAIPALHSPTSLTAESVRHRVRVGVRRLVLLMLGNVVEHF